LKEGTLKIKKRKKYKSGDPEEKPAEKGSEVESTKKRKVSRKGI